MDLIRTLVLISLISNPAYAYIGSVTEQSGSGVIKRENDTITIGPDSGINTMDKIETGKGVVGITFEDDTKVKVSENSELIIDDFVYDPNASKVGLDLKVKFGTVKYASGSIAHTDPNKVNIETPSATIAVRGTAFTMTIDEIGGSFIILLPNADGTVGEIEVQTAMGQTTLNKAFQSAVTRSRDTPPSKPFMIKINENLIDNLVIVSPPKEIIQELINENNSIFLDKDYLKYSNLDIEYLNVDHLRYQELDLNELDMVLLVNLLDATLDSNRDGNISGYNEYTGVFTIIEDPITRIARYTDKSKIDIQYMTEAGMNLEIISGVTINIKSTNVDSTNTIRINQE